MPNPFTFLANRLTPAGVQLGGGIPTDFEQDPVKHFAALGFMVNLLTNLVFLLGVALTVIFLILGGIRYISSGGDKEGIASAKKMITGSLIGFFVVIGAWGIRELIEDLLIGK